MPAHDDPVEELAELGLGCVDGVLRALKIAAAGLVVVVVLILVVTVVFGR